MNILILSLCIVVLVLQIVRFKINPFIAFITTSLLAGLTLGVPVDKLANTIQKGFGDMLGSITLIIIFWYVYWEANGFFRSCVCNCGYGYEVDGREICAPGAYDYRFYRRDTFIL